MSILKVNSDAVISAFKSGTEENKELLKDLFNGQIKLSDKITDIVTSFEAACEILDIGTEIPIIGVVDKYRKHFIAEYKLIIIAEALNEGWKPDFNNWNEKKWHVYLLGGGAINGASAGLGHSYAYYSVTYSYTNIGSCLCFKSNELADYCRINFKDLWLDYFNE